MSGKGLAVIVGASQGAGETVAKGLAEDGYTTVLLARNKEKLDSVAKYSSEKTGRLPYVFSVDITNHAELFVVIEKIKNMGKPVDVLVNVAGRYAHGTLDLDEEEFRTVLETNVVAQFTVIKNLVPLMKQQKHGYIIDIASRAGKYGFSGRGLYVASKFALVGLGESLYRELAAFNIKVTTVCPAWINTAMASQAKTPFPGEDMIQPEDILNTIRYLLNLSKGACIREMLIECPKSVL